MPAKGRGCVGLGGREGMELNRHKVFERPGAKRRFGHRTPQSFRDSERPTWGGTRMIHPEGRFCNLFLQSARHRRPNSITVRR